MKAAPLSDMGIGTKVYENGLAMNASERLSRFLVPDTVSPESDLGTGAFSFLPLRADDWVEAMARVTPQADRQKAAAVVTERGFDSRTQTEKLQAFYLQCVEDLCT